MINLYKYELLYFLKTPRLLVLIVLGVLLSLISVATARYMHIIMEWALALENITGIDIPPGSVLDAQAQFFNNFQQIYFLVLLFIGVGVLTKEKTQKIYPYLITHPVSRHSIVIAKLSVIVHLTLFSLIVSGAVFAFYTAVIFEGFSVGRYALALLVYLMVVKMFILFVAVFAFWKGSYFLSITMGIVVYIAFSALTFLEAGFFSWMPWHLLTYSMAIVNGTLTLSDAWGALLLSILLSIAMFMASLHLFTRQTLQ